jgi:hypothetical protein
MGVSMLLLLLLYVVLFWEAVPGGGGRANGLGGPCAPALNRALADGEGGGNTTPEWHVSELFLAGVAVVLPFESRGDDSAVALPASEFSLGICTFKRGRFAPICRLSVRERGGISGIEERDCVR